MKPVVALLVALVGAGAWFVPYRARVVKGPTAAPGPTPLGRCEGMRLHVFNTGFNRMSPLLAGANPPWRPAPAFAIEHPRAGVVLFDTGLSEGVAQRGEAALPWPMRWLFQSRGLPGRTLPEQLRETPLGPAKVVVLSHQHEDHTGAVEQFKAARVVGGAAHAGWEQAQFPAQGPAPFDASADLFGDGCVRLVPGGGHTREDVMALLALPEGPVLLTGDAVVHFAWLASDDVERIAVDAERAAAVRNQVRAFLRDTPGAVVVPGHDLSRLPHDRADIELHHPAWFASDAWPTDERSWFN